MPSVTRLPVLPVPVPTPGATVPTPVTTPGLLVPAPTTTYGGASGGVVFLFWGIVLWFSLGRLFFNVFLRLQRASGRNQRRHRSMYLSRYRRGFRHVRRGTRYRQRRHRQTISGQAQLRHSRSGNRRARRNHVSYRSINGRASRRYGQFNGSARRFGRQRRQGQHLRPHERIKPRSFLPMDLHAVRINRRRHARDRRRHGNSIAHRIHASKRSEGRPRRIIRRRRRRHHGRVEHMTTMVLTSTTLGRIIMSEGRHNLGRTSTPLKYPIFRQVFLMPTRTTRRSSRRRHAISGRTRRVLHSKSIRQARLLTNHVTFRSFTIMNAALNRMRPLMEAFLRPNEQRRVPTHATFRSRQRQGTCLHVTRLHGIPLMNVTGISRRRFIRISIALDNLYLHRHDQGHRRRWRHSSCMPCFFRR